MTMQADPRVTVTVTGANFGDVTFSRDATELVGFGDDSDDAYQLAMAIYEFANTLRRMYAQPEPAPSRSDLERDLNTLKRETGGMLGDEGNRIADLIEAGTAGKTDAVFVLGMHHAAQIARRG